MATKNIKRRESGDTPGVPMESGMMWPSTSHSLEPWVRDGYAVDAGDAQGTCRLAAGGRWLNDEGSGD